jgi:large-conductance mechanosensitive channel
MFKSRKGVTGIIGAAIGVVLLVVLITSVIMPTLKTANTTGWSPQEVSIWNTLGVFVVLGVLVAIATGFLIGRLR